MVYGRELEETLWCKKNVVFLLTYTAMLLFEQAMKEGYVEVSIIKCLLLGTAGVGKTCLLCLLLDMLPPHLRQSTACIEQAIRAICAKYGINKEGKWQKVDSDGLRDLLAGSVFNSPLSFNKGRGTASTVPVMEEKPTSSGLASYTMEDVVKRMEDVEEEPGKLQDMTWVYLVDSGGQPQFHELLSAFVRNALVGIFVQKLSERLDDHPHVRYFDKKGKECGTGHRSPLSNRGIFQHCIQTVQSLSYTTEESLDPNLAIVGTFRDEEHLCKGESRSEKNEQLLEILHPILGKVFFLTGMDKVIFPVNAMYPSDEDKDIAKKLRQKIESLKPPPEKLPLKWYGLELELEKEVEKQERWVFTKNECLQVAKRLHFPSEKALDAALVHLDKLNIFLYYPLVLPELVFCSPCVLLDKISELVEESYRLKHGPDPYAMVEGKFLEFCKKGQVTAQLLQSFPKHYTEFFTQAHLLKLFESLLIVAPIDCGIYFMPSLLDVLTQSEINRPSCGCQLVISFQDGCAPLGLFSSLVALLLSDRNKPNPWVVAQNRELYRNYITFSLGRRPGLVVLIDSAAFFEVYLNLECEGLYENTSRYVSLTVEKSLNEAIKIRNFQNIHYDKAILCPCKECCRTLHPALPCPDNQFWKCTRNEQESGKLEGYQLVWMKNYTDNDTGKPHTVYTG